MLARSFDVVRDGYNEPMSISDDWNLERDTADETLSVQQVADRIQALLKRGFPAPFWLAGETVGLDQTRRGSSARGGHWYFKLVDDKPAGDRPASLNVKMWRRTVDRLFGARGRYKGRIEPADGVVMRVLVKPDFWPPGGQLSFTIEDVDPEHTLGNLDRQRREVLARLEAEGAAAWNKARTLPEVPLRLGLVTSNGSAAHQDVLETLRGSGLGFEILFCDARTQGRETVSSVCAAIRTLAALEPDALILVRGGGSRLDLSWFDQEQVARAVARCTVPVLSGIGHEIDTSIADLMAHTHCRTPTAAAELLVARVREAADGLERARVGLVEHVRRTLDEQQAWLQRAGRELQSATSVALLDAERFLGTCVPRLEELAGRALSTASDDLHQTRSRLVSGAHVEQVARLEASLGLDAARLASLSERVLTSRETSLEAAAQRVRLLDPRSVLARGYAYLRREDGSVLMDTTTARDEEKLTAVLRDGELDVVAGEARPNDPDQP